MKRLLMFLFVTGLVFAVAGCGKKEEPLPPPPEEESVKENLKEAGSEFKETADETAKRVGHAFKNLGEEIGGAFKDAKNDMEE